MISSHDKEIQDLVSDIQNGVLLLPELQRKYVWKSTQVRDLFDSLYHEYPSGQLLVWETNDLPYSQMVSIEGINSQQFRQPQLLLDGQQRLTSLTAIMLGKPLIVRGNNRPIDIAFNVFTERSEVVGPRQRGEMGWISLSELFTQGAMELYARLLEHLDLSPSNPDAKRIHQCLTRLENIKKYKYRVNLLSNLDYEEVTRIFVRINSGGTILSSADLAFAQISSRWRGISQEFTTYQKEIWKNKALDLDNGLLLRTMAVLLNGQSRLSKFFRGERRDIGIIELENVWNRTKNNINHAIEFLIYNCMIDKLSMLSTQNILVPLAAFFDRFGANINNTDSRELQRWVYMALIWSRYSTNTETSIDQDVAALNDESPIQSMIQHIEDKSGRRPVSERELRDQRKNSPLMLMSYVLARMNSAKDWFNSVAIGGTQALELHHIFPKTILREHYDLRADSRTVDQVANLVFLSKKANSRIASQPPSKYLIEIDQLHLKAQHIPLDISTWQHFEEFILQRRILIADGINKLLQSLTTQQSIWPDSDVELMEQRIEALEHTLRDLVAERLMESRGEAAWDHCIPKDIRESLIRRVEQRLKKHPYEQGYYTDLAGHIQMAQFSDYGRIISLKENWSLFTDVFGGLATFEQHIKAITTARNAIAHNNHLSKVDLLNAEAGLLWIEECLRHLPEPLQGDEPEDELDEV